MGAETPARGALLEGRYRLAEPLDDWGVGECWSARDTRDNVRVAVKLLPLVAPTDRKTGPAFQTLAKRLERLEHRGVLRTLAHGFWNGRPYLVTEHFEGTSLKRGLEAARRAKHLLAAGMIANVLDRACEGVAAAHGGERPLVHGALEPASVVAAVVGDRLEVRVMDFGLASLFGARLPRDRAGEYTAPELEDDPGLVSAASDVFSLGAIVMECITDRATVSGNAMATVGGLSAVARRRDDLPAALTGVASRATKLSPDARFEDVGALRTALAQAWAPPDRPVAAAAVEAPVVLGADDAPPASSWVQFEGGGTPAPIAPMQMPVLGPMPPLAAPPVAAPVVMPAPVPVAPPPAEEDFGATMVSTSPWRGSQPSPRPSSPGVQLPPAAAQVAAPLPNYSETLLSARPSRSSVAPPVEGETMVARSPLAAAPPVQAPAPQAPVVVPQAPVVATPSAAELGSASRVVMVVVGMIVVLLVAVAAAWLVHSSRR